MDELKSADGFAISQGAPGRRMSEVYGAGPGERGRNAGAHPAGTRAGDGGASVPPHGGSGWRWPRAPAREGVPMVDAGHGASGEIPPTPVEEATGERPPLLHPAWRTCMTRPVRVTRVDNDLFRPSSPPDTEPQDLVDRQYPHRSPTRFRIDDGAYAVACGPPPSASGSPPEAATRGPSQNGIAHFLEHMALLKGTKTRSALQIAEEIEDVGG